MIEIKNLYKSFNDKKVLENVNLKFEKNHIYGLLGNNGAGKTTLIKLIFSEIKCDSGDIISSYDSKNNWFYFVDNIDLPKNISIQNYLSEVRFLAKIDKKTFNDNLKKSEEILEIKFKKNRKIKTLSSGQQKLLSLLVLLTVKPDVVFFDEPTANLDPQNKEIIIKIIANLKNENRIVVVVTHLIKEVENILTDVVILDSSKIVYNKPRNKKDDVQNIFNSLTTSSNNVTNKKMEEYLND
ncbi:ABC transporter ATP-binding protein [Williamsoniiplasma somnilux]|uniref:ABC transporter ATP-binding protein n=1 Tax=Williamsoniiplasma somnilux TaxID=215578 RepID=A0A2K8NXD6_9MOLU|nr:ABC transporter ATP-binding protein [Williamsoniiplasma somnilux]ATZ18505.1 ABC transporter ATP-binding protein [Williamsoniiplasma somnilux]